MIRVFIIILFISNLVKIDAQEINWTSFDDLNDSLRINQKPIMVFVHTTWCKYCKIQENTTFKDSLVVSYLNKNYYNLRLDADTKDSIHFFGKLYIKPQNDYHDLARFLAKEKDDLAFPTTIFLSSQLILERRFQGLITVKELNKKVITFW